MKHANIAIFIPHLGCPYHCIFCQQNRISHQGKIPSPSEIASIIDKALITINPDETVIEAAFFGGSFTALPESIQENYLEAVQPYLIGGLISSIRLSTRPDCINETNLRLLSSYGVKTIELGVQSFVNEVLYKSGREYSAEQATKSCRLIKKAGLRLGIQLMIGLPGSSRRSDFISTCVTIEEEPDLVRIYPTLVIDDTELAGLFNSGLYQPLSLEEAVERSREMYLAFQKKGIRVIRMGLHPGEELRSPGTIAAGPYHPAFGELVMQAAFREQAVWLIKEYMSSHPGSDCMVILVNQRDLSQVLGWKKTNLHAIKSISALKKLIIKPSDALQRGELVVKSDNSSVEMKISRQSFLELRPEVVNKIR